VEILERAAVLADGCAGSAKDDNGGGAHPPAILPNDRSTPRRWGRRHCQQKPIGRSSQAKFKTLDVIRHFYEWYRLALSRRDRNLLQKGHISSRDEWHGNFK